MKNKKYIHKICRRYQEDLWGTLSLSNSNSKTLDFIFSCYVSQPNNKKLILSKGLNKLNIFKSKNIDFKYMTKDVNDGSILKKRSSIKVQRYLNRLKLRTYYGGLGLNRFKKQLKRFQLSHSLLSSSFIFFLESRLEVVLYRLNLFPSIWAARQFINHSNLYVNGKKVNKAGLNLNPGDIISLDPNLVSFYYKRLKNRLKNGEILVNYPSYIEANYKIGTFIFLKMPTIEEVSYPFAFKPEEVINTYFK